MDDATKSQISRGQRLTELLKQPQYQPYSIWQQVASVYAATNGLFDDIKPENIKDVQAKLLSRLKTDHKSEMNELDKGAKPTDDQIAAIVKVAKAVVKGLKEA